MVGLDAKFVVHAVPSLVLDFPSFLAVDAGLDVAAFDVAQMDAT